MVGNCLEIENWKLKIKKALHKEELFNFLYLYLSILITYIIFFLINAGMPKSSSSSLYSSSGAITGVGFLKGAI